MNNFLLDLLCLGAILSGILVITNKNPVISVLFLISVFVFVAGYLVLLGVGFIGISYLIVYVGAIAILFLFVVMMLNLQLQELSQVGKEYTQNLPLGTILGSLFVYELVQILKFSFKDQGSFNIVDIGNIIKQTELGLINWINEKLFNMQNIDRHGVQMQNNDIHVAFKPMQADENFESFLQIQSIGQLIYTTGMAWLILCSIILLLAMIGPITLSMNKEVK